MIKQVLLAGAALIAVPAIAQTAPMQSQTMPQSATAPAGTVGAASAPADPTAAAPTAQQPTGPATTTAQTAPAQTTGAPTSAAPAQSAQAQPASGPAAIQSVVDKEFATYDKDGNGSLDKAEFAAWMDALKAKQPAGASAQMADPKWNEAAFAQADADKSNVVSKSELTTFLSGGKASS